MKTAIAVLTMLVFATVSAVADDPSPPPVSNEALIASLPKQFEREHWKSLPEDQRKSPAEAKLAEKMRNIPANCRELQSRLVVGKPLSDYPGLLTVGVLIWMDYTKEYILKVQSPIRRGEGDYAGFSCTFDQALNIKSVSPSEWVF